MLGGFSGWGGFGGGVGGVIIKETIQRSCIINEIDVFSIWAREWINHITRY